MAIDSCGGKKEKLMIDEPAGTASVWFSPVLLDKVTSWPLTWADQPAIGISRRVRVVALGQLTLTWSTVASLMTHVGSAVE